MALLTQTGTVSVVIPGGQRAGTAVAELWSGSALVGLVFERGDEIVVRLGSHALGPIALNAAELERGLAHARERLASCRPPGDVARDSDAQSHVLA